MAIFQFGSGVLLGARTDIADATPVNFGLVQEVQLDLSYTTKELYGQNQFAIAIGARHRQDDRQGQDGADQRPRLQQSVLRHDPVEQLYRLVVRRGRHGTGELALHHHASRTPAASSRITAWSMPPAACR